MSALFEQGFFVRTPAWHGEGTVLDAYPGREEAMRLAGHDFTIVERPVEVVGLHSNKAADGWKALVKSGSGEILHLARDTYEVIQNDTPYDIAELLFDQGFQYDAGVTLDGGAFCALTLLLDEPMVVPGDNSATLPYGVLRWAHNGSAALTVESGAIRVVCMNTYRASESANKGRSFTFRHTKNVQARIEDAKKAIRGTRAAFAVYAEQMQELAEIRVTPAQRDLFVSVIVGDIELDKNGRQVGAPVSMRKDSTVRVKNNIDRERTKVLSTFVSDTIPEAHALTGYGLFQAGVEYFDHLRNTRGEGGYVKRQLLTDNGAKATLADTVKAVVADGWREPVL
jgi:phage/plasmid-like protein (TIGR03299 family)